MSGETVGEWQALKKSMARQAFTEKFPHPFLIRRIAPEKDKDGDDFGDRLSFHTNVVDSAHGGVIPGVTPGKLLGGIVLPIVKKPSNPFPDRISVGRALNCDVVVRDGSVSKLHGHFKVLGAGEAEFSDLKSANGTKVNGKPVTTAPAKLTSGDTIIFGGVALQFLDAKRLWEIL